MVFLLVSHFEILNRKTTVGIFGRFFVVVIFGFFVSIYHAAQDTDVKGGEMREALDRFPALNPKFKVRSCDPWFSSMASRGQNAASSTDYLGDASEAVRLTIDTEVPVGG